MTKRFLALMLALILLLPAAALARTLEKGMEGEDVKDAQQKLQYYEFYSGPIDGKFGNVMRTAVIQFQRKNELVADGKIGPKTQALLDSTTALKKSSPDPAGTLEAGMSGEAVKDLQRALRQRYYYAGTIDGIYGANVVRAVKAFQASTGLYADGKAGKKTQDALYNGTASIFTGGLPLRSLSQGDRGYDVYVLQLKLYNLNVNLSFAEPGYYDSDTVAAVKEFQTKFGLKADGKYGPTLRRYLWPTEVNKQEEQENQNKGTIDDPYTERTLMLNMYGTDVANAQMRLKAAGYLFGKADGIFGKETKAAVIRLQKDYGLKQDGIIGKYTWQKIKMLNVSNAEPDVVDPNKTAIGANTKKLYVGCSGPAVTKLQRNLIKLLYLPAGADDGKFGPQTKKAVMQFQLDEGLAVDGVAGYYTFARLQEALGIQYEP